MRYRHLHEGVRGRVWVRMFRKRRACTHKPTPLRRVRIPDAVKLGAGDAAAVRRRPSAPSKHKAQKAAPWRRRDRRAGGSDGTLGSEMVVDDGCCLLGSHAVVRGSDSSVRSRVVYEYELFLDKRCSIRDVERLQECRNTKTQHAGFPRGRTCPRFLNGLGKGIAMQARRRELASGPSASPDQVSLLGEGVDRCTHSTGNKRHAMWASRVTFPRRPPLSKGATAAILSLMNWK